MTTMREYRAQRPNRIFYETVTFEHPSFSTVNLVNNQHYPKTLGGIEYLPCNFEIAESQQSKTPIINATVKFTRIAQDFKQKLKDWRGYSRMTAIECTHRIFDSADMQTAIREWTLYVKDCSLDVSSVNVSLSMTNPLNKSIAKTYDPADWTGLQVM